jgi:Ammonium Transporter Family
MAVSGSGALSPERCSIARYTCRPTEWTQATGVYGGGGKLLASNLCGALIIAAWTVALIGPFFYVMNVLGLLRISAEEEIVGNDVSKHGGVAYPIDAAIAAEKAAAREVDNLGMDDSLKLPNTV